MAVLGGWIFKKLHFLMDFVNFKGKVDADQVDVDQIDAMPLLRSVRIGHINPFGKLLLSCSIVLV